jgi:hypothetical protein
MCPARARGLAKRRKQSLHVFFAMARQFGGVQAELSAGSKNGEREREVEREQARELRGELEYSGTASFSLLFIPFFLLDFFPPFPLRFIFVFVFDTFNRGESLLVLVGPCKSHQRYFSAPF